MQNRFRIILIAFLTTSLPVHAVGFDSRYSSINEADCRLIQRYMLGVSLSCPPVDDIQVVMHDEDLRQSLTLYHEGREYPLDFWSTVTPYFSLLGQVIEWRYRKGRPDKIIGMIVRLNVSENEDDAEMLTSYLVVSKIWNGQICVVGKISPQLDGQQNQRARKMVERSADMPCIEYYS